MESQEGFEITWQKFALKFNRITFATLTLTDFVVYVEFDYTIVCFFFIRQIIRLHSCQNYHAAQFVSQLFSLIPKGTVCLS